VGQGKINFCWIFTVGWDNCVTTVVFADGDFRQLVAERGVYAFRRALPTTQTEVVVAVNCGTSEYKLSLNGRYTDMLNGRSYDNECNLQPMDYVVLQKDLF